MAKYKYSEISKTLEKLFKNNINTTEKIAKLKWQDIDSITEFTPLEKSLIMDFKIVVEQEYYSNRRRKVPAGIVEFLAGNIGGVNG